jgi:hypothetical protein
MYFGMTISDFSTPAFSPDHHKLLLASIDPNVHTTCYCWMQLSFFLVTPIDIPFSESGRQD